MTKNQFQGLVNALANVCRFNTSRDYSLSLHVTEFKDYFHANLLVFLNTSRAAWTSSDIALMLSLGTAWSVNVYFETLHGVTVAKFI